VTIKSERITLRLTPQQSADLRKAARTTTIQFLVEKAMVKAKLIRR
jgi:uncharacterized protein (DUF1778 family)